QFRFNYTATPEIVFGLNFDLSYKSFDLNMFFQGQTNAYNYDGGFASLGNSNFDNASVYRSEDRWSVDNPNGSLPRAADNAPSNNTMWLFDATFARLKNMEIGYSLPASLSGKAGLSQTRIYLSGSNLLTWAKEIKWADPEMNGGFLYYPQQRVLNIGANVKF
ncbi:MAG TPA: SusC/RagA family TonB-linked outer membrane protein, partial [Saprospiraceae bacterium]|nr:SusC/RagA family TonB-linked outer membrane protein [Saprospiraceae bacterium]